VKRLLSLAMIHVLALFWISCASDTDSGKGPESNPPINDKTDSFKSPTLHGELEFGPAFRAEITQDSLFHAWDFTLLETSHVILKTVLKTPNLDTVMYLYQYKPDTESWGSYIARNDDFEEGTVASGIEMDLAAGRYRVLPRRPR